jgi:hypothetical protein
MVQIVDILHEAPLLSIIERNLKVAVQEEDGPSTESTSKTDPLNQAEEREDYFPDTTITQPKATAIRIQQISDTACQIITTTWMERVPKADVKTRVKVVAHTVAMTRDLKRSS